METLDTHPAPFQDPTQKKSRFPLKRIIAISIGAIIGVPLMLVSFVHFQSAVFTKASDIAPRDLVISETTSTSATIQYYTDQPSQAVILYNTDPKELKLLAPDQEKTQEHNVTVSLLVPKTTYYFAIKIGEEIYMNGTEPYTFTTKALDTEVSPTSSAAAGCPVTNDCDQIKTFMGKICSSSDYIQCLKRKGASR